MKIRYFGLLLYLAILLISVQSESDDEEPHTYTISFFQFDPKDIGVGNTPKKQSKKDIKPSDIKRNSLKNKAKNSNLTEVNVTSAGVSDLEKVKKWKDITNKTQIVITNKSAVANVSNVPNNKTIHKLKPVDRRTTKNKTNRLTTINNQTAVGNFTMLNNNTLFANNSQVNKNNTQKQITISHPITPVKKSVLNPNPHPSLTEANQNILAPVKQKLLTAPAKNFQKVLFEKNKTLSAHSSNSDHEFHNSQKLVQTGKGSTKLAEKDKLKKVNTDDKLSKLEKDKKRNEEIQKNAKKIQKVSNMVDAKALNNVIRPQVIHDDIKHKTSADNILIPPVDKKQSVQVTPNEVIAAGNKINKKSVTNHVVNGNHNATNSIVVNDDDSNFDEMKLKEHREKVKQLLPKYSESRKDHNLKFQIGSLKHPKHDIFPKCHQCQQSSTYTACVKKSTLKTCNQDLNNICYTRSMKQGGNISYQMGCTNHKNCSEAKAYPCKDGSKQCFTCCQFDSCNSSPHHGDFELDQVNLDELKLDTNTSIALQIKSTWYHIVLTTTMVVFLINKVI